MKNDKHAEQGNILVSSLLILVSMNLLGAGLMQNSFNDSTMATFKSVDSETFHITETCAYDVIAILEATTATPSSVGEITVDNVAFKATVTDNLETEPAEKETNKLSDYNYNCTTEHLTTKSVSAGTSVGGEVGGAGGEYGSSGGIVIKDYYKIVATGEGPNGASKVVNTIISVQY